MGFVGSFLFVKKLFKFDAHFAQKIYQGKVKSHPMYVPRGLGSIHLG